ncbi:hypothetical protein R1flu_028689 [Riccia fluitans]|uniref:Uncharacterized protein n=1 Tax=Riccia fluitans TaxID=41844 RepID=A0ABD1XMF5_9MARC
MNSPIFNVSFEQFRSQLPLPSALSSCVLPFRHMCLYGLLHLVLASNYRVLGKDEILPGVRVAVMGLGRSLLARWCSLAIFVDNLSF